MMEELICYIIQFEDGTYFNGVKGKCVRKTKHFKDVKIININNFENSRDFNYLNNRYDGYKYTVKKVQYTMGEINE